MREMEARKSFDAELITDIQRCLYAGAWKVFVEAAELFDAEGRLCTT